MAKFDAIIDFLKSNTNHRLLAGISGGADSVALFCFLITAKVSFEAVHFEHGLRGEESKEDAQFVKNLCAKHNIPLTIVELNLLENLKKSDSLEAKAREQRLNYFRQQTKDFPNTAIVLAHHQDDCVENLLLKLARGGNVSSLTSLRKKKKLGKLTLLRPLLSLTRMQIEEFLQQNLQAWRVDQSNFDNSFQRNFLRNNTLPQWQQAFPAIGKGFVASLNALEADAQFVEFEAEKQFKLIQNHAITSLEFWQQLPQALLVRVAPRYLAEPLTSGELEELKTFFAQAHHGTLFCTANKKLKINRQKVELLESFASEDAPFSTLWNPLEHSSILTPRGELKASIIDGLPTPILPDYNVAYFSLEKLKLPLQITQRQGGEKIQGFDGKMRSVKKLLINNKLSEKDKAHTLLVYSDNQLIWLPKLANSGVGKVDETTQKILKLELI